MSRKKNIGAGRSKPKPSNIPQEDIRNDAFIENTK